MYFIIFAAIEILCLSMLLLLRFSSLFGLLNLCVHCTPATSYTACTIACAIYCTLASCVKILLWLVKPGILLCCKFPSASLPPHHSKRFPLLFEQTTCTTMVPMKSVQHASFQHQHDWPWPGHVYAVQKCGPMPSWFAMLEHCRK